MTYTFWHAGVLIGESEMDHECTEPRQLGGDFSPTEYGLEIFPRLTGILTAGRALKSYLDAEGLDPDTMTGGGVEELLQTTEAGLKILDIGRALSDVEMRGPDGQKLEFDSIGFSDILEFKRLALEDEGEPDLEPELPPGVPRYIVSATLTARGSARLRGSPRRRQRR